jgi:hypothetical protein
MDENGILNNLVSKEPLDYLSTGIQTTVQIVWKMTFKTAISSPFSNIIGASSKIMVN